MTTRTHLAALAATLTALARHTGRAATMREGGPSSVLAELHQAFLRYQPDEFCTVLVA